MSERGKEVGYGEGTLGVEQDRGPDRERGEGECGGRDMDGGRRRGCCGGRMRKGDCIERETWRGSKEG